MSAATAWPGFAAISDQRQIDWQAAQLEEHFGGVSFEGGERLSGEQVVEYDRLTLAQAQRHGERADALERQAKAHRDRAERLAEEAAPVETTIAFGARGPELVERKAPPAPPADERVDLAEAATRLGLSEVEAVVYLGLDGHMADDAGTFLAADVDAVKDAR